MQMTVMMIKITVVRRRENSSEKRWFDRENESGCNKMLYFVLKEDDKIKTTRKNEKKQKNFYLKRLLKKKQIS